MTIQLVQFKLGQLDSLHKIAYKNSSALCNFDEPMDTLKQQQ
jgi:hypothetical protein